LHWHRVAGISSPLVYLAAERPERRASGPWRHAPRARRERSIAVDLDKKDPGGVAKEFLEANDQL
jgi:hypothetical protein